MPSRSAPGVRQDPPPGCAPNTSDPPPGGGPSVSKYLLSGAAEKFAHLAKFPPLAPFAICSVPCSNPKGRRNQPHVASKCCGPIVVSTRAPPWRCVRFDRKARAGLAVARGRAAASSASIPDPVDVDSRSQEHYLCTIVHQGAPLHPPTRTGRQDDARRGKPTLQDFEAAYSQPLLPAADLAVERMSERDLAALDTWKRRYRSFPGRCCWISAPTREARSCTSPGAASPSRQRPCSGSGASSRFATARRCPPWCFWPRAGVRWCGPNARTAWAPPGGA